jgi:hypothetical protein
VHRHRRAPREEEPEARPAGLRAAERDERARRKEWSDIEVSVIDGHTIRVQGGKSTLRLSFLDVGFGGADRNPIDKWRVVEAAVAGGGIFRGNRSGAYESARNAVCVAQNLLKEAFGLPDNPFHRHKRGLGWKAKFVVKASPDDGET